MPEPGNEPQEESSKPTVPEGIKPVFLSTATQRIFGCEADVDVTGDNPNIFLSKEKLLEDIHNRAAVSDFQPLKATIKVGRERKNLKKQDLTDNKLLV